MTSDRHNYDPKSADPRVQAIITALIARHEQHGQSADVEQEALARRQLRFISVGGKPLNAAYIDSALAYARKEADLKAPGRPS
jgi:hypothetical protein